MSNIAELKLQGQYNYGTIILIDKIFESKLLDKKLIFDGNYIYFSENNKKIALHRFITNAKDHDIVDHINRNVYDNRLENLRLVTHAINLRNKVKSNYKKLTSIYKGVYWNRTLRKWHAQIRINYKKIHLGYFKNEDDAAIAYNLAVMEIDNKCFMNTININLML